MPEKIWVGTVGRDFLFFFNEGMNDTVSPIVITGSCRSAKMIKTIFDLLMNSQYSQRHSNGTLKVIIENHMVLLQ